VSPWFSVFLQLFALGTGASLLAADWLVRPPEEVKADDLRPFIPRRKVLR
jgi:hypothetical protein